MKVTLTGIGKKFNNDWIFREITWQFTPNLPTAIIGKNGSGKSTLLQLIAGNISPSRGIVEYTYQGKPISDADIFRYLALASPYQELIEEFTLRDMLEFHFSFKRLIDGFTLSRIIDLLAFPRSTRKQIRQFSSGMKQRVKLACAILSDTPLLLLDEPAINLDKPGLDLYEDLIRNYTGNRTVIVCSNAGRPDVPFSVKTLMIEDYQGRR